MSVFERLRSFLIASELVRANDATGDGVNEERSQVTEYYRALFEQCVQAASELSNDEQLASSYREIIDIEYADISFVTSLLERDYFPDDLSDANRVLRCLQAAFDGSTVRHLTPIEEERMTRLDALADLDFQDAFKELVKLSPPLLSLEQRAQLSRKANGNQPGTGEFTTLGSVQHLLRSLLGPDADCDDPILSSRVALQLAIWHIESVAGLLDGFDGSRSD